jgi:TolB-like protein/Tfp pilus assembly protein PilF
LAAPVAAASIAVLPFADMSPGKDQEYFADGISEEILNTLARLDGLKVVGRTSSFSFKGKGEAAAVIAGKLQVAHLLEGSVRRDGNRVRISAQLVSARDGFQVWGESFDRELTGVFAIQDEIARAVVNALKVKLLPGRESASAPHLPANPEVYSQYLLGLQYLRRGASDRNFRLAAEAFEKAIALDSSFAPAWANLANPLWYFADIAATPAARAEAWKRAFAATERAISIDPFLPAAYLSRGRLRWLAWDWAGAQADVDRVLALDPNSSKAHQLRGRILATMGRPKEAIAEFRRAIDLDPLDNQGWLYLNQPYRVLGNMGSARDVLTRSRELAPEGTFISLQLAIQSVLEGQPAVALAEFERLPHDGYRLWGAALAHQALGQAAAARQALDALKEQFADTMAYDIAILHARWGERDAAFEWLDRAYRQHDGGIVAVKSSIFLRPLRDDPRYIALLRKMNLPVD